MSSPENSYFQGVNRYDGSKVDIFNQPQNRDYINNFATQAKKYKP